MPNVITWIAACGSVALLCLLLFPKLYQTTTSSEFYGHQLNRPAPPFAIDAKTTLDTLSGEFIYILFGFLHCKDICHLQLRQLEKLALEVKQQAPKIQHRSIFVSLDPEQDSSDELTAYFKHFETPFTVVRPESFRAAQQIALEYREYASKKKQNNNKQINHNGTIYLIDPTQQIRLIYPATQLNIEAMVNDLRMLHERSE